MLAPHGNRPKLSSSSLLSFWLLLCVAGTLHSRGLGCEELGAATVAVVAGSRSHTWVDDGGESQCPTEGLNVGHLFHHSRAYSTLEG